MLCGAEQGPPLLPGELSFNPKPFSAVANQKRLSELKQQLEKKEAENKEKKSILVRRRAEDAQAGRMTEREARSSRRRIVRHVVYRSMDYSNLSSRLSRSPDRDSKGSGKVLGQFESKEKFSVSGELEEKEGSLSFKRKVKKNMPVSLSKSIKSLQVLRQRESFSKFLNFCSKFKFLKGFLNFFGF
jgi:hypothetical protein